MDQINESSFHLRILKKKIEKDLEYIDKKRLLIYIMKTMKIEVNNTNGTFYFVLSDMNIDDIKLIKKYVDQCCKHNS